MPNLLSVPKRKQGVVSLQYNLYCSALQGHCGRLCLYTDQASGNRKQETRAMCGGGPCFNTFFGIPLQLTVIIIGVIELIITIVATILNVVKFAQKLTHAPPFAWVTFFLLVDTHPHCQVGVFWPRWACLPCTCLRKRNI